MNARRAGAAAVALAAAIVLTAVAVVLAAGRHGGPPVPVFTPVLTISPPASSPPTLPGGGHPIPGGT